MKIVKHAVMNILRKAGWELHRINAPSRPTMIGGLKWLHDHNFHIKTVLDVGASNGCWSKECMIFFPNANYILFEPQPVHSDAIDSFVESCDQKIIAIKKAVGSSEGQTFFDASEPFGGSLAKNAAGNTIKVNLTTIDNTVAQLQLDSPFLLKLDTHGFEKSILEGSEKTLQKTNALIIEAYNYKIADDALLFWELCAFLSKRGFSPIDLVDVTYRNFDNSLWQMDLFFIRSTWEGFRRTSYA